MKRSAAVIGVVGAALMAVTTPSAHAQSSQYVRTESGKVRCVISAGDAACERTSIDGFPDAPPGQFGGHQNIAQVDANGDFSWTEGNIGAGESTKTWCWPTARSIGSTDGPSCRPSTELV